MGSRESRDSTLSAHSGDNPRLQRNSHARCRTVPPPFVASRKNARDGLASNSPKLSTGSWLSDWAVVLNAEGGGKDHSILKIGNEAAAVAFIYWATRVAVEDVLLARNGVVWRVLSFWLGTGVWCSSRSCSAL